TPILAARCRFVRVRFRPFRPHFRPRVSFTAQSGVRPHQGWVGSGAEEPQFACYRAGSERRLLTVKGGCRFMAQWNRRGREMRSPALITSSLAALLLSTSLARADGYDAKYVGAPPFSWTGMYLGYHSGIGIGS